MSSGVEACDDGNVVDGDGCSSACTVESGYECRSWIAGKRSLCSAVVAWRPCEVEVVTASALVTAVVVGGISVTQRSETTAGSPPVPYYTFGPVQVDPAVASAAPVAVTLEVGGGGGDDPFVEVRQCTPFASHKPLLCAGRASALDQQGCFALLTRLCKAPCGNGRLDSLGGFYEQCDDGNTVSGDGCSSTCLLEVEHSFALEVTLTGAVVNPWRNLFAELLEPLCGDEITQVPREVCDGDGCIGCSQLTPGCFVHPITRRSVCWPTPAVCGDGIFDPRYEVCDDGNAVAGDGCSPACVLEVGDVCGDAVVGPSEACERSLDPRCAVDCTAILSRLPLHPLRIFAGGAFDDSQSGKVLDDRARNTAQFTVLFSDGRTIKTYGANADSAAGLGTTEPLGATPAGMGDQLPPVLLGLPAGDTISQICMVSDLAPGASPAASVTTCVLTQPQGLVKCFGTLAQDRDPSDGIDGWSCPTPSLGKQCAPAYTPPLLPSGVERIECASNRLFAWMRGDPRPSVLLGAALHWTARADILVVSVSGAKEHCVVTDAGALLCTPPVLGRFNIDPDQFIEVGIGAGLSPVASVSVTSSAGVFAGVSTPLSERALAACVTFQDPADGLRCFGSRFFGVASDTQASGFVPGTHVEELPTYAAGVKPQGCFTSIYSASVYAFPRTLGVCTASIPILPVPVIGNCEVTFHVEARLPVGTSFKISVDGTEVINLSAGVFPETKLVSRFLTGQVEVELAVGPDPEDLFDPSCDCYRVAFVRSRSDGFVCTLTTPPTPPVPAAGRMALQQAHDPGVLPDGPMLPTSINFWSGDDPQELADLPALDFAGLGAPITSVAVGRHSCAVTAGRLFCWGDRSYLAAGPTDVPPYLPFEIDLGAAVAEVSVAGLATCARLVDSTVRCFGTDSARTGQLGGASGVTGAGAGPSGLPPLDLSATKIASLSLNTQHTCAIINGGNVKCVGAHALGLGSAVAPIELGYLARSVSAGPTQTCAITEPAGRIACFSLNGAPPTLVELPRDPHAAPAVWSKVLVSAQPGSVSATYDLTFSLALDASTGKLYTWGADIVALAENPRRSYPGTLAGQRMSTEASLPPRIELFRGSSGVRDLSPFLNPDGTPITHVCAAEGYFCVALRWAQHVKCVGFLPWITMRVGERVASGPDPWAVHPEPEFLTMTYRGGIKSLSCGESTVCMVFEDNSVVCHFTPQIQMLVHGGFFTEMGSPSETLNILDVQVGARLVCFLVAGRREEVRCAATSINVNFAQVASVALSVPTFLSENVGGHIMELSWHSTSYMRVYYTMALAPYTLNSDAFRPVNLGYARPIRSIHAAAAAQRLCALFMDDTAVCMGDNSKGTLASTAPAGVYSLAANSMGPSIPRVRMGECQLGFEPASLGTCAPCRAGTYLDGATLSRTCVLCSPGAFSNALGASDPATCQPCPPGTFSGAGSSQCLPCAPGTFAAASGAAACVPARPGYHVPAPRGSAELPCDPGYFSAASGASECTRVLSTERREYTPGLGAPVALVCPENSRSTGTSCTCLRGYWLAATATTTTTTTTTTAAAAAAITTTAVTSLSCVACAAGRYGIVEGATSEAAGCLPCAPGTASLVTGRDSQCPACPMGSFSPQGASACSQCPPGSFSSSAGASSCTLCEVGTRNSEVGASSCLPCLPGSFSAAAGSTTCTACPPGTYAPSPKMAQCLSVAAGSAPSADRTQATPCPVGTFAPTAMSPSCAACPAQSTTASAGSSSCSCLAGYYMSPGGTCLACPAGTFSVLPGSTSLDTCARCPAGSSQPSPGSRSCTPCAAGLFSNTTGALECRPCPPSSTSAPGSSQCSCDAGFYMDLSCVPCPAGTFGSPGATTAVDGCRPCGLDLVSPRGAKECSRCALGYFASLGVVTVANLTGTATIAATAERCSSCPAGSFFDPALRQCQPCVAGTFSPSEGRVLCTPCSPGTASSANATACTACAPGTFTPGPGLSRCQPCAPGTFLSLQGASSCRPCEAGTRAFAAGLAACTLCPVRSSSNGTHCLCDAGTYDVSPVATAAGADPQCQSCPEGADCSVSGLQVSAALAQDGYWRGEASSVQAATFYKCPIPKSCTQGGCAAGYTGVACASCAQGFHKFNGDRCIACPRRGLMWLVFFALVVVQVLVVAFLVFLSLRAADREHIFTTVTGTKALVHASQIPTLFKIFLNYIQLLAIASQFDLDWPPDLVRVLTFVGKLSTLGIGASSLECELAFGFFDQARLQMIVPVAGAGLAAVIWLGLTYRKARSLAEVEASRGSGSLATRALAGVWTNRSYFVAGFTSTLLIVLFVSHPHQIMLGFKMLTCERIDGVLRLRADLETVCWSSSRHIFFATLTTTVALGVYGALLPAAVFAWLFTHRKNLTNRATTVRFGFLYRGYRPAFFWWEVVIIIRKLVVIVILVFGTDIVKQAAAATWFVFLVAIVHTLFRPFESRISQGFDLFSLITTGSTLMIGILFESDKIPVGSAARSLGLATIAILNSLTVLYLVTAVLYDLYRKRKVSKANAKTLARRELAGVTGSEMSLIRSEATGEAAEPSLAARGPSKEAREARAAARVIFAQANLAGGFRSAGGSSEEDPGEDDAVVGRDQAKEGLEAEGADEDAAESRSASRGGHRVFFGSNAPERTAEAGVADTADLLARAQAEPFAEPLARSVAQSSRVATPSTPPPRPPSTPLPQLIPKRYIPSHASTTTPVHEILSSSPASSRDQPVIVDLSETADEPLRDLPPYLPRALKYPAVPCLKASELPPIIIPSPGVPQAEKGRKKKWAILG